MRQPIIYRFVSLALVVSCCRPGIGQIVFDDGQEHILTEDIDQLVIVSNQSRLDVQARMSGNLQVDDASVGLSTGGQIRESASFDNNANLIVNGGGDEFLSFSAKVHDSNVVVNSGYGPDNLDADGNSVVTVNGGSLGPTSAKDASLVVCNGGYIGTHLEDQSTGPALRLEDSARLQILDGGIGGYLGGMRMSGLSSAQMSGGSIESWTHGSSGTGLAISDGGVFQMSGGSIFSDSVGVVVSGVFQMSGGVVEVMSFLNEPALGLAVAGNGQLEVTGGQIRAQDDGVWEWEEGSTLELALRDNATATVIGNDFNFPLFEPVQPLEGTLVGTLRDGTSIEWRFRQSETATIMLVPEPSAWLLLLAGLSVWIVARRSWCRI